MKSKMTHHIFSLKEKLKKGKRINENVLNIFTKKTNKNYEL